MFQTEKELVIALLSILEDKKLRIEKVTDFFVLEEAEGMIGRPDVLLKSKKDKKVITIEVKLRNWKRALQQAYKYRSFSDIAFICMDEKNIIPALTNIDVFKRSNIGLISINAKNELKVHFEPTLKVAYIKELRDIANNKFTEVYG